MKRQTISRSPDVMGGAPVFAGTRVPVQTLLDYLEAGESIDDFLEGKDIEAIARLRILQAYDATAHKRALPVAP